MKNLIVLDKVEEGYKRLDNDKIIPERFVETDIFPVPIGIICHEDNPIIKMNKVFSKANGLVRGEKIDGEGCNLFYTAFYCRIK